MANTRLVGVANDSSSIRPQGNQLFQKRWGHIDWRKIASLDMDKVAQELDFQALQDNIMSVAFCNVETEFHGVDPNFIKLFRIGQLIIEYLLHSQQYLGKQSSSLEQQCLQIRKEQIILKEEFEKLKEEKITSDLNLKTLQKENRKRRKVIEAYQDMMKAGATGLHPCPVCKREFISMEYLKSHMERRHPENVPEKKEQTKTLHEELEARLLQQMSDRLHTSENQLREEMKQKEINTKEDQAAHLKEWKEMEQKKLLADYQERFEEWKAEETKRMKAALILETESWKVEERKEIMLEHQESKKPILQELDQLHKENLTLKKEKLALEIALQKKEEELVKAVSIKRHSHLGHLEDSKEIQLEGVDTGQKNKSDSDVLSLKETMEQEVKNLRALVKKRDTYWKSRLRELHQQSVSMAASKTEKESSRVESAIVSKEIESLKSKQKKQERLLQTQHDELVCLKKQESSKEKSRTNYIREGERTSVHVLDYDDSQIDGNGSVTIDSEDSVEFENILKFSPIKDRPKIKTIYPHSLSDMEIIRQQTHALFVDTLSERNIDTNQLGLTSHDLEAKMALLQDERKMTKNSNYDEHRHQICERLEEYCSKGLAQTTASRTQLHQFHETSHVKGVTGKPPTPRKLATHKADLNDQTGSMLDDSNSVSDSSIDTSLSCDKDGGATKLSGNTHNGVPNKKASAPDMTSHGSKDTSPDLEENDTDEEEIERQLAKLSREENKGKNESENGFLGAVTATHQPSVLATVPKQKMTSVVKMRDYTEQEDSPWDSSSNENSIKETITALPRTASTPLKGWHQTKTSLTENIGAPPDNVSLGSFELSSSNELVSNPPHKVMVSSTDKLTMQSKNATSQSALTNISLDEFDLSDLSDIL